METLQNLSSAYSLSVFGIEVEIDQSEPITQDQVNRAIAALDGLESRIVTPMQLATAIAMLRTLPAKPTQLEGGRQVPTEKAAAKFAAEYRIRAEMIRGCSIE